MLALKKTSAVTILGSFIIGALLFSSFPNAHAQTAFGVNLDPIISAIGGGISQGVAQAQAASPNINILPACPSDKSPGALQTYLQQTPGLDAAIASGNTTQAQNLIASAIAACPNGIATITPGIPN